MSQVLQYGVPHGERILCEAPGCTELAVRVFTTVGSTTEGFACKEHAKQMTSGKTIARYVTLKIPGERNVPEGKSDGQENQKA
jgi:hypothetical protein